MPEPAMDWDEPKRPAAEAVTAGESLETLSIAELEARIAALTAEIDRTRAEIAAKKAHEAAAAAVFKT
jgi:uncharacterized small protein (DUF1192 family)